MEIAADKESGLGSLFQQIIVDMKNGMPLWEDLIAKATKLHSSLKATILAVTAYLEAFQKIADLATKTRGGTRDIGSALTRICLRHKAVESRMKHFTGVIMEGLIIPLQDKLEEWRKSVMNLDKEHARDVKRARAELNKRSTDTLRLQKKMRKGTGGDMQKRFECGLQDVSQRRQLLEDTEKQAVRIALIEERRRFCTFVGLLKPVVDEEVAMLTEVGHLQEAVQQLEKHTTDPNTLPPSSEQVITDLKSSESSWSFQTPPASPSSLGSRKSSMCSISSLNSSSSGSSKSHHSPSHPHWQRSISQVSNMSEQSNNSSNSNTPCRPFPGIPATTSTWPNLQETIQFEKAASAVINERPHTISSAYEKGHSRPPLTVYTFQAPDQSLSQPVSPVTMVTPTNELGPITIPPKSPSLSMKSLTKPPLPTRCSSLERPIAPSAVASSKPATAIQGVRVLPPGASEQLAQLKKTPPSALPAHMAANKPVQPQPEGIEREISTSESSLESSSGYGTTEEHNQHIDGVNYVGILRNNLLRRGSMQNNKPPPPIRRTSSITNASLGSLENLPPPPAFLLEPSTQQQSGVNVAETVKALTELKHTPASPNALRRMAGLSNSIQNICQMQHERPSSFQGGGNAMSGYGTPLSTFQGQTKVSYLSQSGGVVYAQPSQIIGENLNVVRRSTSFRSQSADRKSEGSQKMAANFIAKLTPNLSPKSCARSPDNRSPPPNVRNQQKPLKGPGQSFLDSLNAKLAAQQHLGGNAVQSVSLKASKIRQIINSQSQPDPKLCHESLMDQIKRGATLRRAKIVNDRSAPKIY